MNNCEKEKIPLLTNLFIEVIKTKALHAVLICLIIFAIFNYTATAIEPVLQQENGLTLDGKDNLYKSLTVLQQEKSVPINLADPIDDPTPH